MTAAYPASFLSWTSRVNSETVYAADPNTLADEIDAIEKYVGTNPHVESSALTGATKTFSNLSARVSGAMLQSGHPYIQIARTSDWKVWHNSGSTHVTQSAFNVTNASWPGYVISGGNVTIKDSGVWLINAYQKWQHAYSGWVQHVLLANGSNMLRRDVFSYSQFPGGGSNSYGERFLYEGGYTETTFLGKLNAGTVISAASGNYTNVNPIVVHNMELTLYYLRP